MEYVVYCDESRHEGLVHDQYMAIGSLWVPRERKAELTAKFKKICRDNNINSEVKWQKTSNNCFDAYSKLIDLYFEDQSSCFRVIIVDKSKIDLERYHNGDSELGFYKFYYEMLIKWISSDNDYVILLDFKKNKDVNRYKELRKVLTNSVKHSSNIKELNIIESSSVPLAQLCDLLTGAVAASWCRGLRPEGPKEKLAKYIAQKTGKDSLTFSTSNAKICKFNAFKIWL